MAPNRTCPWIRRLIVLALAGLGEASSFARPPSSSTGKSVKPPYMEEAAGHEHDRSSSDGSNKLPRKKSKPLVEADQKKSDKDKPEKRNDDGPNASQTRVKASTSPKPGTVADQARPLSAREGARQIKEMISKGSFVRLDFDQLKRLVREEGDSGGDGALTDGHRVVDRMVIETPEDVAIAQDLINDLLKDASGRVKKGKRPHLAIQLAQRLAQKANLETSKISAKARSVSDGLVGRAKKALDQGIQNASEVWHYCTLAGFALESFPEHQEHLAKQLKGIIKKMQGSWFHRWVHRIKIKDYTSVAEANDEIKHVAEQKLAELTKKVKKRKEKERSLKDEVKDAKEALKQKNVYDASQHEWEAVEKYVREHPDATELPGNLQSLKNKVGDEETYFASKLHKMGGHFAHEYHKFKQFFVPVGQMAGY